MAIYQDSWHWRHRCGCSSTIPMEVAKNLAACYRAAGCEDMLQVAKQGGASSGPPESPPAWIDYVSTCHRSKGRKKTSEKLSGN